jgi:hypothetical protein
MLEKDIFIDYLCVCVVSACFSLFLNLEIEIPDPPTFLIRLISIKQLLMPVKSSCVLTSNSSRVTRCVCEKVAQNVAQSIFVIKYYVTFALERICTIDGSTSVIFTNTTQRKQPLNRRKFAQSGHPVTRPR